MKWFKFYNKWLTDLRIGQLDPIDRLIFVTLLCVTNEQDERDARTGTVTHYCEQQIITLTRLPDYIYDEDKNNPSQAAVGCTERLEKAGLIERIDDTTIRVKNYSKAQNTNLTPAERAKRYRVKNTSDDSTKTSRKPRDERHARLDKTRLEYIASDANASQVARKRKTTTTAKEPFSCDAWVEQLRNDKQRHIQVIGEFLAYKRKHYNTPNPTTKAQAQTILRRHLRAARQVAEFDGKQMRGALENAATRCGSEMAVETMLKYLTK